MSVINQLINEREQGINFYIFFSIIAKQENVPIRDVAAFFYRNKSTYIFIDEANDGFWEQNFLAYTYSKLTGFDSAPDQYFQERCTDAIKAIAEGYELTPASFGDEEGFYIDDKGLGLPDDYQGFFYDFLFKKSEMIDFLNKIGVSIPSDLHDDESKQGVSERSHGIWGEFAGKDTALMFIAGMAIALEKSSPKFKHGCKMNKNAIANAAIKAINDYGNGTMITPKSLTNLINEALEKHTTNLD